MSVGPGTPGPFGLPGNVEAFACDLDRTLIAEDVVFRDRTLTAIAAARAAGIRVLIATGRMFRSVLPYARTAGIDDPLVCYQGAVVADPTTGEFLRHEPIPLELARETIAAIEEAGFQLNVYVDDELYVARTTPEAERYAVFQKLELHEVGDVLGWLDRPPTKLVSIGDPVLLDGLAQHMRVAFDGRLFIAKSLPYFLEFAQSGVTKGTGLEFAAAHVGLSLERTVAFGDGENDVELLETAGYGIAVENAHPRLREIADAFCPPAEEEGVAQVIEAYLTAQSEGGIYSAPTELP